MTVQTKIRGFAKIYEFTLKGKVPSKKNMYRRSRNGGMFINADLKADLDALLWQFKGQKRPLKPLEGAIALRLMFTQKTKRGDIDNKITALLDILQKAEIIKNDKDVSIINAEREYGKEDKVELVICEL